MKRWQGRILFGLLISALFFLSVLGCGVFHPLFAGGPYRGRVIDAETKQPLEGAVVLAIWETKTPGVAGYGYSYLDSKEVLTDENGRFVVGLHPPMSLIRVGRGSALGNFLSGLWVLSPISFQSSGEALGREQLEMMEKQELTIELPCLKTRADRLSVIREAFPGSEVPGRKYRI